MKKGVEGLDGVFFCKVDSGCKDGESHDLKDKCAMMTGYHFTWDGTKCELCESVKNALEPEEEDADDDNSSLNMMIMLANVILLAAL
jgi:hypothetical protein